MESQKFSHDADKVKFVYLISLLIKKFLGNNAASIIIKKARFFATPYFLKTAFYDLDTEPEPEP
jgi:hypothetical protein